MALWVTEHGYPGETADQCDPVFRGGEPAQAAYLRRSLPALVRGGGARVFVTLRDNLWRPWLSEGILGGDVADPPCANPTPRYKPAAWTVRNAVLNLGQLADSTPRPGGH